MSEETGGRRRKDREKGRERGGVINVVQQNVLIFSQRRSGKEEPGAGKDRESDRPEQED